VPFRQDYRITTYGSITYEVRPQEKSRDPMTHSGTVPEGPYIHKPFVIWPEQAVPYTVR